jgi:hypothetical protein
MAAAAVVASAADAAVGTEAVRQLLQSFGLGRYAERFETAGYDDLSYLAELAEQARLDEVTGDVGMEPSHAATFTRWLDAYAASGSLLASRWLSA